MIREWPTKIPLAQTPTPLQPLNRISRAIQDHIGRPCPTIWCKRDDLTGSLLSGNKIRKLEYTVAYAMSKGHDSLITCGGLQSNHCRATAFVGAQLGLPVYLLLREGDGDTANVSSEIAMPDGNLLLDQLAGAMVSTYDSGYYQKNLATLLSQQRSECEKKGLNPYIIPTGASNGVGVWGYLKACYELKEDFFQHNINPEHIVVATGSGGTQAGLSIGAYCAELDSEVVGFAVCDNQSYFERKVAKDIQQWYEEFSSYTCFDECPEIPVHVNDHYKGSAYGVADDAVLETITWLAREEGILLDPVYTGKAFYGLVEEIKKGNYSQASNIVFVHTGGVFGVFPQREKLIPFIV